MKFRIIETKVKILNYKFDFDNAVNHKHYFDNKYIYIEFNESKNSFSRL